MSDKIYSIDEIKNVIAPIAIKYDVDRVLLFGSYAKGEANNNSDLDFIIDKGRLRGLKLASMLGDLQDSFNKNVDLLTLSSITEHNRDEYFMNKIEKNMVVIYEQ